MQVQTFFCEISHAAINAFKILLSIQPPSMRFLAFMVSTIVELQATDAAKCFFAHFAYNFFRVLNHRV